LVEWVEYFEFVIYFSLIVIRLNPLPPSSEWRNLATHCGQADMLQFLQHVDASIFREIVAQDSLYVRI
jgi:hypothetical protein